MKVIGLTGGIASGKSSVGAILRKLGVRVVDADQIAHRVYLPETPGYTRVVQEFGAGILDSDGHIDRKRLGEIVFQNPEARVKLEKITHPVIMNEINRLIAAAKAENCPIVVVEVPLLFEAGLEGQFDYIWVVSAHHDIQLKRLMERNRLTFEEASARLSAQLPLHVKEGKADVIVYNNRGLYHLEEEIKRLLDTVNFSPLE
jgi:dephospho-CoA kinase